MKKSRNTFCFKDRINGAFSAGKIREKLIITLIILIILVALALLIPAQGRFTWRGELSVRREALRAWQDKVNYYIKHRGYKPASLYEASSYDKKGGRLKVPVMQNGTLVYEWSLIEDPNLFFKEVEYTLATAYPDGWFIVELKPGKLYPYRLIIDEKGNISELREVKCTGIGDDK